MILKSRVSQARIIAESEQIKEAVRESNLKYAGKSDDEILEKLNTVDRQWLDAKGQTAIADGLLNNGSSHYLRELVQVSKGEIGEIFVTDVHGATVAMSSRLTDYYQADEQWWEHSFNQGKGAEFIDDRGFDESMQALAVGTGVPIKHEDKVVGILKIHYKVQEIINVIEHFEEHEEDHTFLMRSQGDIITVSTGKEHPDISRLEKEIVAGEGTGWIEDTHHGKGKLMSYSPVDAEIFRRIPQPGEIKGVSGEKWVPTTWYLFIEIDHAKAFAPLSTLMSSIAICAIATVIFSVVLAVLFARPVLAAVKKLQRGVVKVGKGNLEYEVDVTTNDEIGSLAVSFNTMTKNLSDANAERKRVEEALLRERDNLTNIFDSIEDGVYIVDKDYNIQYINPALLKEFGAVEGRKCYEYFHDRKEVCPWCKNVDVLAGKSVHWEWKSEKTGKTYDLIDMPVNNPDGTVSKLEIFRDITERKRIEEELELESHMRTVLLDNVPNCFAFILKKGTREIVACNQAAKDAGGSPGKTCYQTCAQRDDPCPFCLAPELWNTNEPKQLEVEHMGRYYEGIWVPLSEELYVHYIFDITERKHAEDALRKSEERFKLLYEGSPLGYQSLDAEGNLIEANPAWLSLLGYDREEVIGRSFSDFLASGFGELFKERFPCFKAAGEACSVPFVMIRKDGSHVDIEIDGKIGYNPDGSFKQTHCVLHDVTERKRAEVALRESEERFRSLVDNIPGASYRCRCDEHWTMEFISDEIEELSGYPATDFLQNSVRSYGSIVNPEDRKISDRISLEAIARKEPFTVEYRIATSDGGIRWVYEKGQGIFNEQGEIYCIDGVIVDITERKRAEEDLRRAEQRHRSLVSILTSVVWIADAEGKFVKPQLMWEEFTGQTWQEHQGWGWAQAVHPDDRARVENLWLDAVKNKATYHSDGRIIRANGTYSYYEAVASPILDDKGEFLEWVGTVTDITERKQAEDALQDKTKEMETLLRAVSHDLRTPLVNIDGFSGELASDCEHLTEMMEHVKADEETKKEIEMLAGKHIPESLSFIRKGTKKMDGLLKGLSYLAKVGTAKLDIQRLDINDIAGQVVDTMKFSAREAGATIELETLPDCYGDEVQVNQIFSNLIGNAVKYLDSEREGRIRIWGKVEGGMAQYCVEDNGVGIPDYHKAKVFEIFHRVDPKSSASGDGLGLTTTKQIVERHNGRIWLESEEGKGSKFFVAIGT